MEIQAIDSGSLFDEAKVRFRKVSWCTERQLLMTIERLSNQKRTHSMIGYRSDQLSAYSFGLTDYKTPNIDRIRREGMMFTGCYAEQSCRAGRWTFITEHWTLRTAPSKVCIPGATVGLQARDATIAELLKPLGYATGSSVRTTSAIVRNICRSITFFGSRENKADETAYNCINGSYLPLTMEKEFHEASSLRTPEARTAEQEARPISSTPRKLRPIPAE